MITNINHKKTGNFVFAATIIGTLFLTNPVQAQIKSLKQMHQEESRIAPISSSTFTGNMRRLKLTSELLTVVQKKKEDLKTVKRLVKAGADVKKDFVTVFEEKGNRVEFSALQQACMHRHWRIVNYLISQGGNVNPLVRGSQTHYFSPISCAAGHSLSMVKRMVAHGANINSDRDDHCGTPLMEASYVGKVEIVKYLLSQGVRVNAVTNNHYAALDWAELGKDKSTKHSIISLLKSNNAKSYGELRDKYPALLGDYFNWPPPKLN